MKTVAIAATVMATPIPNSALEESELMENLSILSY
jgi:hypothetical protein